MTAFFIATVRVRDAEKFQDYAARAGATFAAFGGEMVIRGKAERALTGEGGDHTVGVVKFPDMEALNNWYQSADYQEIIPLRDAAADMTLVSYSVPA